MAIDFDKVFPFIGFSPAIFSGLVEVSIDSYWGPLNIDIPEQSLNSLTNKSSRPKVIELYPFGIFIPNPRDWSSQLQFSHEAYQRGNSGTVMVSLLRVDYRDVAEFAEMANNNQVAVLDLGRGGYKADADGFTELVLDVLRVGVSPKEVRESLYELKTLANTPDTVSQEEFDAQDVSVPEPSEEKMSEAFDTDPNSGTVVVKASSSRSHIHDVLYNYLSAPADGELRGKVPLLIGDAGTAKSKTIQAIARELGYRMIDFRAQFLDKLDLEGLQSFERDDEAQMLAFGSPQSKFFSVTDAAIKTAKVKLEELKKYVKLDEIEDSSGKVHPVSPEEKQGLNKVIEVLEELSKPAVLFLDEIYRAPSSVAQALTSILNTKQFIGFNITKSRVVCASNVPVEGGMDPDKSLPDYFYLGGENTGKAYLDRFTKIIVTSGDMAPSWWEYISDPKRGNFHESIVKFCKGNPKHSYDMSSIIDAVNVDNVPQSEAVSTPYPNFRSWELISNYIVSVEAQDSYYDDSMIYSLMGKAETAEKYVQSLHKGYPQIVGNVAPADPSKSEMDMVIERSMTSNTPLMLLGASSLGKTTKVAKYARENSWPRPYIINLSQKSRNDILGFPVRKEPLSDVAALLPQESPARGILVGDTPLLCPRCDATQTALRPKTRPISDDKDYKALEGEDWTCLTCGEVWTPMERSTTDTRGIPSFVSDYAPNGSLKDAIRKAVANRLVQIIYFNEFNRAKDEVRSAIFEAVSESRLAGVSWKGDEQYIRIVCDGNFGEGYEVFDLDPAFATRFSVYKKEKIEPEDIPSILDFMKGDPVTGEGKWKNVITKFFSTHLDEAQAAEMLNEVERINVRRGTTNLRSFNELSVALKESDDVAIKGRNNILQLDPITVNDIKEVPSALDKIKAHIPHNWTGLSPQEFFQLGRKKISGADIMKELQESIDLIKKITDKATANQHIARLVMTMNEIITQGQDNIKGRRDKFIGTFLGYEDTMGTTTMSGLPENPWVSQFTEFFDREAGEDDIDFNQIVNYDTAYSWASSNVTPLTNSRDGYIQTLAAALRMIPKQMSGKTPAFLQNIVKGLFATATSKDVNRDVLAYVETDKAIEEAFIMCQTGDFKIDRAFLHDLAGIKKHIPDSWEPDYLT